MTAQFSPYLQFDRTTWRTFRQDTPLTLSEADLIQLKGQNESVSLVEVKEIYLPLSRLFNLYVRSAQELHTVSARFLGHPAPKVPYVIGVAGSVAVGKSTTSRILQALLSRWPDHPRVALITTDGFLYPNAVLEKKNRMHKKGFPESYDIHALITFLTDLKAGKPNLQVPIYSHYHYDILADTFLTVDQPDIVIVEGLNVLQIPLKKTLPGTKKKMDIPWFVSDFFDFTLYVDAETQVIRQWFLDRFTLFREKARGNPDAFFYRFTQWSDADALAFAQDIWENINARNLVENIIPFKQRAKLILEKAPDHCVQRVLLRKL